MKKLLTTIPFSGFYNSEYSEELEYCLESEAENLAESHGITIDEASELLYKHSDFSLVHEKIAIEYVKKFNALIIENFEFDLTLEFESMKSPREYNFTTDIIFAYLPEQNLKMLLEDIDQTSLEKLIAEKFTSRSGFISYYSNSLAEWLKQPFSEWDHNQLGTLLECLVKRAEDWENDVYDDVYDTMQESIYNAFSDCVKWAEIEAEIEELKNGIIR